MDGQSSTSERRTLVIDLDGTLCEQTVFGNYQDAVPRKEIIDRVNLLWNHDWEIVIFTARGMRTFNGNVLECEKNLRTLTEKWLQKNEVCYDRLIFGKPSGDLYVDDKGMTPDDFAAGDHRAF